MEKKEREDRTLLWVAVGCVIAGGAISALAAYAGKPKDTVTVTHKEETVVNHVDGRIDQIRAALEAGTKALSKNSEAYRTILTSPTSTWSAMSAASKAIEENDIRIQNMTEKALDSIQEVLKTGNQTGQDNA